MHLSVAPTVQLLLLLLLLRRRRRREMKCRSS